MRVCRVSNMLVFNAPASSLSLEHLALVYIVVFLVSLLSGNFLATHTHPFVRSLLTKGHSTRFCARVCECNRGTEIRFLKGTRNRNRQPDTENNYCCVCDFFFLFSLHGHIISCHLLRRIIFRYTFVHSPLTITFLLSFLLRTISSTGTHAHTHTHQCGDLFIFSLFGRCKFVSIPQINIPSTHTPAAASSS